MQELLKSISIKVNEKIYLKDPDSSELGRNIVNQSIAMIHEMGLESFTFKKLASHLNTTESTIYRYFENKHKLLLYLMSWYWGWLEYELVLSTVNIGNPEEKLSISIDIICDPLKSNIEHEHISLQQLYEIVIEESPKIFLTKDVDAENAYGFFSNHKRIHDRLIQNIMEINQHFKASKTLASVILDTANQQRFLCMHFPNLTDIQKNNYRLSLFLSDMVLNTIQIGK